MLSCFHRIPERDGQTDGRTDEIVISTSLVSVLTRDKKTYGLGECISRIRQVATPCTALGFLPRDAMHKRGLCCHPVSVRLSVRPSVCLSVRPSVRLSVTFVS